MRRVDGAGGVGGGEAVGRRIQGAVAGGHRRKMDEVSQRLPEYFTIDLL